MRQRVLLIALLLLSLWVSAKSAAELSAAKTNFPAAKPAREDADAIAIPLLLSYQGRLTDTAGRPVPNGTYAVSFRMYAESIGGTPFWSEVQNVTTRNGLFSLQLGSESPLTWVPSDGNCYLEMQVHPDPVMTPRVRIVSAAYAYLAEVADSAAVAGRAPAIRPLLPGVSSAEIQDGAVITDKIGSRAVRGNKIATPCTLTSSAGNPYAALHIIARNTGNGIRIDSASNSGLIVSYCANNGLQVNNAAYGIYAHGTSAGGQLMASAPSGVGLRADAYNNVSTDTAIYARGRGIATGGWGTDFGDGTGAPCVVGSEIMMIAAGTGRLVNGRTTVKYPEVFADHINPEVAVRLCVTPYGNPAGMLVINNQDATGFSVVLKTVPGWDGEQDMSFDWVAVGVLGEPSAEYEAEPRPASPDWWRR